MEFSVTFCAMDSEAGANPFWHTCMLLSKRSAVTGRFEVVENWGFYGGVATAAEDSYLRKFKKSIGFDIDFTGNFGWLKHEEMRYLDAGKGLWGVTFELTEQQFNTLSLRCETMASEQQAAVDEVMQGVEPSEAFRNMPFEHLAKPISIIEQYKAQKARRSPRLKPFNFKASMTLLGPSMNGANTCKSQILNLLSGILSEQQIERLKGNRPGGYKTRAIDALGFLISEQRIKGIKEAFSHRAVPRFSGVMERILLHSVGPLHAHKKKSGEIVHSRRFKEEGAHLYWTLPPQEVELLPEATYRHRLPSELVDDVKYRVGQLQALEWVVINAQLLAKDEPLRAAVLSVIRNGYTFFSTFKQRGGFEVTGLQASVFRLFSNPCSFDEQVIGEKLQRIATMLNGLDFAINDGCDLTDEDAVTFYPVEALAMKLNQKTQLTICQILSGSYLGKMLGGSIAPIEPEKAKVI